MDNLLRIVTSYAELFHQGIIVIGLSRIEDIDMLSKPSKVLAGQHRDYLVALLFQTFHQIGTHFTCIAQYQPAQGLLCLISFNSDRWQGPFPGRNIEPVGDVWFFTIVFMRIVGVMSVI